MNEALQDELQAINAIYGDDTLAPGSEEAQDYILKIPNSSLAVRIAFPHDYPASAPKVVRSETSGDSGRKGEGARVVERLKNVLTSIFVPGEVCLFALLEEFSSQVEGEHVLAEEEHLEESVTKDLLKETELPTNSPAWILSDTVTEKKSVFLCRAATVSSPAEARSYVQHLLSTDKKVARASHNITAWRIRGENNVSYQDCDDDGETAAGGRLLHLLQLMDVWDVMVVVSRWFGGTHLGPDRFRIINSVARDALVKGNYVK